MDILAISQIIFNFTASLVVIIIGGLVIIISYEVLQSIRSFKAFVKNVKQESSMLYQKLDGTLERISQLSFVSKFLNRKKKNKQ